MKILNLIKDKCGIGKTPSIGGSMTDNKPSAINQTDSVHITGSGNEETDNIETLREFAGEHPAASSTVSGTAGFLAGYSLEKQQKARKIASDIERLNEKKQEMLEKKAELKKTKGNKLFKRSVKPGTLCMDMLMGSGLGLVIGVPLATGGIVAGPVAWGIIGISMALGVGFGATYSLRDMAL